MTIAQTAPWFTNSGASLHWYGAQQILHYMESQRCTGVRNSRRLMIAALLNVCFSLSGANAATLLVLDNPRLTILSENTSYFGYYAGQSNQSAIFADSSTIYSCTFFFKSAKSGKEDEIRAFPIPLKNWDLSPYTVGTIFVDKKNVAIQFTEIPKECNSRPDGEQFLARNSKIGQSGAETESLEPKGAHFKIIKTLPAVNLMATKKRARTYDLKDGKFCARPKILEINDVVVTLKKRGKFFWARGHDIDTNRTQHFWIEADNLIDPFPKR